MGKKKFIDKKKSATFQLLARDSSDPNYQDSPGHDRVFIRVDNNPYSVDGIFHESDDLSGPSHYADDPDSIFADAPDDDNDGEEDDRVFGKQSSSQLSIGATAAAVPLPDHVRREILELGFPDDGYNYLTHLREIKNTGGGSAFYHNSKARLDQLPLDVKVSYFCYSLPFFFIGKNSTKGTQIQDIGSLLFFFLKYEELYSGSYLVKIKKEACLIYSCLV